MRKEKRFIFFLSIAIFVFSLAAPVFALELQYPSLPGIGTLEADQSLGFYVRYFLNLFFYVAAGVCVIVLIIGGILYIAASQSPSALVRAKTIISRAFLGLFILLTSYLLLYTINPQLLVLKVEPAPILKEPLSIVLPPPDEVGVIQVPGLAMLEESVSDMEEEVSAEEAGLVLSPSSLPKKSIFAKLFGSVSAEELYYRAEVPFHQIEKILDEVIARTKELQELFKKCNCGESIYHTAWDRLEGQCVPGMNKEDEKVFWDGPPKKPETSQNVCLTRCKDCGTREDGGSPVCDLREVQEREGSEPQDGPDVKRVREISVRVQKDPEKWEWKKIEEQKLVDEKLQWITASEGEQYKKSSIKYKRMLLFELLANLEGQKPKFVAEETGFVAKTLRSNAANFLLSQSQEGMFGLDFADYKDFLEEQGYRVKTGMPEQFSASVEEQLTPPTAALFEFVKAVALPPSPLPIEAKQDPATHYVIVYAPATVMPESIIKHNKETYIKSTGVNLFSVLTDLSLGKVAQIFQECLSAAFGEASYHIPEEDMKMVIDAAIETGAADAFAGMLAEQAPGFAGVVTDKINKGVAEEMNKKKEERCTNNPPSEEGCKGEPNFDKCVEECKKMDIPPHFLSNRIAEFFNTDLKTILPDKVEEILDTQLKDIIFSGRLSTILTTDIIALLDGVFKGALTKSLAEQIPGAHDLLKKKVTDIMPEFVVNPLNQVSAFLASTTKDINKRVVASTTDYIQGLSNKFLSQPVKGLVDSYKEDHPNLFPDRLVCRTEDPVTPIEECEKIRKECEGFFEEGWHFKDFKCQKITLGDVNTPGAVQIPAGAFIPAATANETGKILCEKMGYCWVHSWEISKDKPIWEEGFKEEDFICQECQWIHQDLKRKFGTKENLAKTGRELLGGLVNFAEQFAVALIDTIVHTAVKYATVWVEDTVLYPLQPYLRQLSSFQQELDKLLKATIADILPSEITNVLKSNVEKLLKDVCAKSKTDDLTVKIDLYSTERITVQGAPLKVEAEAEIPKEAAQAACFLGEHLHQTMLEEIATSSDLGGAIVGHLQDTVFNQLRTIPGVGSYVDYLNQTPAAILFPGIKNIEELVKGTPKQVICGELVATEDFTDTDLGAAVTVKTSGASIKEQCNNNNIITTKYIIIPEFDYNKIDALPLSEEEKNLYLPWCLFIHTACRNPFTVSDLNMPLGELGKKLVTELCDRLAATAKEPQPPAGQPLCEGSCLGKGFPDALMKEDPDCPGDIKIECEACNVVSKNSLAFSLFYYGAGEVYGSVEGRIPEIKEKEKQGYQWLLVVFPALESEISDVAQKREFSVQEWNILRSEVALITDPDELPEDIKEGAQALIAWFTQQRTPLDVLTTVPLGVIKPIKPGEATILREKGQGSSSINFLALSPYQVLYTEVCGKVKKDFAKKYPDWTLEAVMKKSAGDIQGALPYSMEALVRPTIAKGLEAILNTDQVPLEDKSSYLFCASLDISPAQILGLDQLLNTYIRPKEYQILFDLVKSELYPDERPEKLNELLDYLYTREPVDLLNDVARKLEDPQAEHELLLEFSTYNDGSNVRAEDVALLRDSHKIPSKLKTEFQVSLGVELPLGTAVTEPLGLVSINDREMLALVGYRYYVASLPDPQIGFAIYSNPNETSAFLKALSEFLSTPLKDYINEGLMKEKIIDLILESFCEDCCQQGRLLCQDIDDDPQCQEKCQSKFKQPLGWEEWNKFQETLKKIPLDLLSGHIKFPIIKKEIADPTLSLMDKLATPGSVLGERYVDTFGRLFQLDKLLFEAEEAKAEFDGWVNEGVSDGQKWLQDSFDTALIKWPTKLAGSLAEKLASWIGINLADQMAGACREEGVTSQADCQEGEIFRTRAVELPGPYQPGQEPETKIVKECCAMGTGLVCESRCWVDITALGCNGNRGEVSANEYGEYDKEGMYCCYQDEHNDNHCQQCRMQNASEGGECHEDEEKGETPAPDNMKLCCHEREEKEINGEEMCCVTVTECVSQKFSDHLRVMSDMLADGEIPLDSLTGKR